MSRQALLSPRSSIVDETDKFICPVCEFANPVVLRDDIEFDDSDDEDVPKYEDTVCQLCRFFDMLLMLSGRVTSTKDFQRLAARREAGGEFIRAADVVLAYKLYQFHTMVPSNNYAAEVCRRRRLVGVRQLVPHVDSCLLWTADRLGASDVQPIQAVVRESGVASARQVPPRDRAIRVVDHWHCQTKVHSRDVGKAVDDDDIPGTTA